MELFDIVMKLAGPIQPVGETYADDRRYKNLHELLALTSLLVEEIKEVAECKDRQEFSVGRAGKAAEKFLEQLRTVEE